ncbi:MAG: DUF86 domain-containing protein [Actinomycetota bacterium]|nr:DUF86 domain-containing protein [Actinomycetota bacterium]
MLNKPLIEKKLRKIEDYLHELRLAQHVNTLEEFKKDIVAKRFIERNIELAIEQVIDICKHFVAGLDLKEPETYSECFDILSENKIISSEYLGTFKNMARFRNILIHTYDSVDDSITYGIYKQRLGDFKVFVREIRDYLVKN